MPHFKSINFYQNRPKITLMLKKSIVFERWGLCPQTSETSPPFQISGCAPGSNQVFVLPISMPPEFSLMTRFKSIYFYQNQPKIKLFLQKNFFECWRFRPQTPNGQRQMRTELPVPPTQPFPTADFWLRA